MRDLNIACGNNHQAKTWANRRVSFDTLKAKLKVPIRTSETSAEYASMSKDQRDIAKDHGGFVAGALRDGKRRIEAVESRSMVTLDGDNITPEFLEKYDTICPYASVLYSTHSSTGERPRVRVLFPLTRDVSAEEFVAVSRYTAQMLGMDYFDECSYRPNQLMYWPSAPDDGVFIYKETDGEWLDPDIVLKAHPEWTDPTKLPISSRETKANAKAKQKAEDPLRKTGVVGLFNRTFYPVTCALDKFLPDVYEHSQAGNRWTLKGSKSMPGVEIINNKFVYSHHAGDPAYQKLCNAFDIVRIHMFGDADEKASFKKMCDFAIEQEGVKILALEEKAASARDDFSLVDSDAAEAPTTTATATPTADTDKGVNTRRTSKADWRNKLQYVSKSNILVNNLHNITLILQNDPNLTGIVYNEMADGLEIVGDVPWKHPSKYWRDADDAQLISYVDAHYGNFSQRNYQTAMTKVCDDRSYHPIRDYLDRLPKWDGVPRVDTILIDYLGAKDTVYVRAVTRKTLCAAVCRVRTPGIKFDTMLVFSGPQGVGKSTLIRKLTGAGDWFSDSLSLNDTKDKTAAEKLQGYWILEFSEMSGLRKTEVETLRSFLSRQNDIFRAAFGKRATPHPRQCIFFGTTNEEGGYLRDTTGNRRFWPVHTPGGGRKNSWDITDAEVQQIWAEVLMYVEAGEDLHLDPQIEALAKIEQRNALESDEREGLVKDYLDTLLPKEWESMDLFDRRAFLADSETSGKRHKGTEKRTRVCNMEIWCELYGKNQCELGRADSNAITTILGKLGWVKQTGKTRVKPYGPQYVFEPRAVPESVPDSVPDCVPDYNLGDLPDFLL